MRFFEPLNKILDNENKVRILRFLIKSHAKWTGRQIANHLQISSSACHKYLRQLHNEEIMIYSSVGRSYLFEMNTHSYIVNEILMPLFKREDKIFAELKNLIAKTIKNFVPAKVVTACFFGSVAKKKEKAFSDLDVIIIVKKKIDKSSIEAGMKNVKREINEKFGNILSLYIQTVEEFKMKRKNKLPVIRTILKDNILITGKPLVAVK
ncbi:MAG: winged helix-turn-helix transcriptional regulator [Elusimicrobia bacterium]|nr:winged helix-turn-helix transcriptional regulator [Elusimicrobiota bacterium]